MKDIKYQIYGSKSSSDLDIMVFVDRIGSVNDAKQKIEQLTEIFITEFGRSDIDIHLSVLSETGYVVDCSHGTVDECNNSLYTTFGNSQYNTINWISGCVDRDKTLKYLRVARSILSFYSRVQELRPEIKKRLRGNLGERLEALNIIDITKLNPRNNKSLEDVYKTIAFQLAQGLGLYDGLEIYTKEDAIKYYPILKPYLLREKSDLGDLDKMKTKFSKIILTDTDKLKTEILRK